MSIFVSILQLSCTYLVLMGHLHFCAYFISTIIHQSVIYPLHMLSSICLLSIFSKSGIFLLSNQHLSHICPVSVFHLSILYLITIHYLSCRCPICLLPTLYHITTLYLSSIHHQFFRYPVFTILLFILQVSCIFHVSFILRLSLCLFSCYYFHLSLIYAIGIVHLSSIYLYSHIQIYYIFQLSVVYPLIILSIPSINQ